jgi:hypothetical protein
MYSMLIADTPAPCVLGPPRCCSCAPCCSHPRFHQQQPGGLLAYGRGGGDDDVLGAALLPGTINKGDDEGGLLHPVARHCGTWTRAPSKTPSSYTIDGPVVGGGGLGIAVGGGAQPGGVPATLFIGHNSFWTANPGKLVYGSPYTMVTLASLVVRADAGTLGTSANEWQNRHRASSHVKKNLLSDHILAPCDYGSASQRWYFLDPPKGDAPTGQIISSRGSIAGATCLDVAGAKTAVVFDACNQKDATPNQNWLLLNDTQQLFSTLSGTRFGRWPRECAEAGADGTVFLRACNSSVAAQKWQYNSTTLQLSSGSRCVGSVKGPAPYHGPPYHAEQNLSAATVVVSTDHVNLTLWVVPNASRPAVAILSLTNCGNYSRRFSLELNTTATYNLPTLSGTLPGINSSLRMTAPASPSVWVSRNSVKDPDQPLVITTCVYGGQQSWSQLFAVSDSGALTLAAENTNYYAPEVARCLRHRSVDGLATVAPCNGSAEQAWQLTAEHQIRHLATNSCLVTGARDFTVKASLTCVTNNNTQWKRLDVGQHAAGAASLAAFRLVNPASGKCLTVAEPNPQVFGAVGLTATTKTAAAAAATRGSINGSADYKRSSALSVMLGAGARAEFVLTVSVLDEFKNHTQRETLLTAVDTARELAGSSAAMADAVQVHSEWWGSFWNRSAVDLGPRYKTLEAWYYGMQYMMAAGTAHSEVAPGLWGPWVTNDSPGWSGDFTTDYNFEMPFQSVASENRPELMMPYFDIIELHTPLAQWRGTMKVWSDQGVRTVPAVVQNSFSEWCQVNPSCAANFSGWEWPSHVPYSEE